MLGHGGHGGQPQNRSPAAPANAPEAAIDPVGGEAVRTGEALTSVYQGRIYYFATKDNRDRFEGAPQEYARKTAGRALPAAEAANERPRRRGGCGGMERTMKNLGTPYTANPKGRAPCRLMIPTTS